MNKFYSETISLCPECAKDCPAYYTEKDNGMFLELECSQHGFFTEKVESDIQFFKKNYELEYQKPFNHLVLPITYRCNLRCKYCYTLSNTTLPLPKDRTIEKFTEIFKNFEGNITLIGGEPTLRDDLLQLIRIAKEMDSERKISLGTNGQKLKDIEFVRKLKDNGLDFVFLSFNDIEYDESKIIYENKIEALNNCLRLNMPVWLQRTIDSLNQLDSILDFLSIYKRIIFNVTVRVVKPFGFYFPPSQIFVSQMLKYLKKESDYTKGTSPFNSHICLENKNVKLCSWINDMKRLDPIDSYHIISNDSLTTFHRGMKMDEVLLKNKSYSYANISEPI